MSTTQSDLSAFGKAQTEGMLNLQSITGQGGKAALSPPQGK
jgi:hypothetical protein